MVSAEEERLRAARSGQAAWKKWGPYLSERQWGTVREDYSPEGNAWAHTPHEIARSKAWRWGEEGLAGICDDQQYLCLALSLWNGKDPQFKERLFGLTGPEGNHGEDVKELYYYLDNTPSHAWMEMLYKYPQAAFPYEKLRAETRKQTRLDPEYEIWDTGVFDAGKYWDVFVRYAKAGPEDIVMEIEVHNRGPVAESLWIMPTLWFRNTWSWGQDPARPALAPIKPGTIGVTHQHLAPMALYHDPAFPVLYCDNDSNRALLYQEPYKGFPKDAIQAYVIHGTPAVNPDRRGTKATVICQVSIPAGAHHTLRLRLGPQGLKSPLTEADEILRMRRGEADVFYEGLQAGITDDDMRRIQRQALAGMLWSKQYYYYDVMQWLRGDPAFPPPPAQRQQGRNRTWQHLNNADIISMPDKWEYPWYAAWDLAFHCVSLALVDLDFAKSQLILLTREWYMHPNGQLPAYEWNFSDVNPPVHAWAAWQVYQMEKKRTGHGDRAFLEGIFHKLLLNFTWWVNRKDHEGNNIFEGGFLGLDNIGVFDRSSQLPTGGHLEQADGTSWMAMYSLNLMSIALELAKDNPVYQDTATKFFEHFLQIAGALVNMGGSGISLWHDEDKFFYDVLSLPNHHKIHLKIRSMVGLIPMFAVDVLQHEDLVQVPEFAARMDWYLNHRADLASLVSRWQEPGRLDTHLLSLLRGHRMKRLIHRMADEAEFLSPYGVRALSKHHEKHPYRFQVYEEVFTVAYRPAESDSGMFGGNSNWRGPVWFPVNYLLIQSLRQFHAYYGDAFKVEYPTGSGVLCTLDHIADQLSMRLIRIFMRNPDGKRPVFGDVPLFQTDPHFRDYLLFYEYFHGDNGRGAGASHQTGWTGLVANLIQELAEKQSTKA
ncbi:MAG: glucosidase [Bacteroidia bacterium]|nr:glucosidase [Bacteroidia bacterium]